MRHSLFGFLLCVATQAMGLEPADITIVETVLRMESFDLNSSDKARGAVTRYLDAKKGSETYFELIKRFELKDRLPELLDLANASSTGVNALKLALHIDSDAVKASLADDAVAEQVMKALVLTQNPEHLDWIDQVAGDDRRTRAIRSVAAKLSGKPLDVASTTVKPLPDIGKLASSKGSAEKGKAVFNRACAVCHKPSVLNVDFGPNLVEIGDKLPREDLYRSILDPNEAISMGFEGVEFELKNGGKMVGVIGSETDEAVTVLLMGGIQQTLSTKNIVSRKMLKQSLMPVGLHETMSRQELVDLVFYLEGLKKNR